MIVASRVVLIRRIKAEVAARLYLGAALEVDLTFLAVTQPTTMAVPRSRILDLMKVSDSLRTSMIVVNATQAQCRIFSTTFNPEGTRTGNKVLRQRLKGPALAAYYPRRTATLRDLRNAYPGLETWDEDEEDRLEHLQL